MPIPIFGTMIESTHPLPFPELASRLRGALHWDLAHRAMYACDASVYRILPKAVAEPAHEDDLREILAFARKHKLPVTARTAGTSLAGQAIGEGIILDFSLHWNRIAEVNAVEKSIWVQVGVIRDELNRHVKDQGLFFGPNTSTANRCMIGGMVANNSSGTTSIRYGVSRDKLLEAKVMLSKGQMLHIGPKSRSELEVILRKQDEEGRLYRDMLEMLGDERLQEEVRQRYPRPDIHRRNTGYALDALLNQSYFTKAHQAREGHSSIEPVFNLAPLLAGSEGTLALLTEVKLQLDDLPPPHEAVVCAHFQSLADCLAAAAELGNRDLYACELMDKTILDCTKDNMEQAENRFFVEGDPAAILALQVCESSEEALAQRVEYLQQQVRDCKAYATPALYPPDSQKVWQLRAAGLGVLSNVKGDAKPLAFVEDTAVGLEDLPAYIKDFEGLMQGFGQKAVYYAHAGAGELHIRPVLNLKSAEGRRDFRAIAEASAKLVAGYRGSLSGEHGDGRARSELIEVLMGKALVESFGKIKRIWDTSNILNPGLIVDPEALDRNFRYDGLEAPAKTPKAGKTAKEPWTYGDHGDMLRAAEACNGSGDCRKLPQSAATMCPSYQASLREGDSTRARANMLREALSRPINPAFPLDNPGLRHVLDTCMSCKACKRECPSSVDMAKLKAESDYHYYKRFGFPLRTRFFGHFHKLAAAASWMPALSNALLASPFLAKSLKKKLALAPDRDLPKVESYFAFRSLLSRYTVTKKLDILLYIDEFTRYQELQVARAAAELFTALGYHMACVYAPSGRAYLSKGMLDEARDCAIAIRKAMDPWLDDATAVVGLEPSAVLGLRDELPELAGEPHKDFYKRLEGKVYTFEEFVHREYSAGRIGSEHFIERDEEVYLHVHCHQKALSHVRYSKELLQIPKGLKLRYIPSGCCGMAGSFGYEAEHYKMSMDIAGLVLLPQLRKAPEGALVVAAGTSCRQQIMDAAERKAMHPAELLRSLLKG